jgi:hypothetical protein
MPRGERARRLRVLSGRVVLVGPPAGRRSVAALLAVDADGLIAAAPIFSNTTFVAPAAPQARPRRAAPPLHALLKCRSRET